MSIRFAQTLFLKKLGRDEQWEEVMEMIAANAAAKRVSAAAAAGLEAISAPFWETGRCTRRYAQTARMNAQCRSSLQKASLYIAGIATASIKSTRGIKMKGTIKFFNVSKGFGFIKADEDGKEYFVHKSGVAPGVNLAENTKVNFEVVEGDRGEKADKVTLA
jgi:CspA family cold shock protein